MPDAGVVGITNYHVIQNNAQHVARVFTSSGGHHDCRILHVCPALDFAILEAPNQSCSVGVVTTATPACGADVVIPGFPLATTSDSCQFSYGHMSAPNGDQWLQCSLSCNSGNSGGPLILTDSMAICGICTASPAGAEGITLALPMLTVVEAVRKFRVIGEVMIRTPSLHTTLTPITSAWASLMRIPPAGLVVSSVSRHCPLRDLQEGDVITEVNGMPVNTRTGKVPSSTGEWDIDLNSLSAWILLPPSVPITLFREGVVGPVHERIANTKVRVPPIRELHPLWERIPALSIAGATCVPLCYNVLESYDDYSDDAELRACWRVWDERSTADSPRVVVVFVEPHSYAAECGIERLGVFQAINGTAVSTIDDIERLLMTKRSVRSRPVKIEFLTSTVAMDMVRVQSSSPVDNYCPLVSL